MDILLQNLVENLHTNCTNENELCDILVDLCYGGGVSKQILWKACGEILIERLLKKNNYKMSYPQRTTHGEFWCQGVQYTMKEIIVKEDESDETV